MAVDAIVFSAVPRRTGLHNVGSLVCDHRATQLMTLFGGVERHYCEMLPLQRDRLGAFLVLPEQDEQRVHEFFDCLSPMGLPF